MRRAELKTATGRTVTVDMANGCAVIRADGDLVATMLFLRGRVGDVKAWKMAFYAARGLACQLGHAARNRRNRKARTAAEGGAE